ncbi:ROK family protein [Marinovum sp.]|uniref:ROK family protein n=1 Tax=Marinovum sp. TaxID=2024839 RepID=UPI002B27831F|nr:ROK family protein [Marinovum sp.]
MSEAHRGKVLSIDIGGTKTMVALIEDGSILERRVAPTRVGATPDDWVSGAADLAGDMRDSANRVAAAVTGRIKDGAWSALNAATLDVPRGFPLVARLESRFGLPGLAVNDAQAAAWAEYRHGAGAGKDMVFLTVSTGVGGGIVLGGRLLAGRGGIAGHFGITDRLGPGIFEDRVSGRWMAAEAARAGAGPGADARTVFDAAAGGALWAEAIVDQSATRMAGLMSNIQVTLDPDVIVLGGGIGMAPGYLSRIEEKCAALPDYAQPCLVPAQLGAEAGIMGAAALADLETD